MAKKYLATFFDAKGNPVKVSGPYYGELTEGMLDKMIASKGNLTKAKYLEVSRVTGGTFVTKGRYDISKKMYYPYTAPAGSRYGPGYY